MTKEHPKENDVKAAIRKLLDRHGWFHWPASAGPFARGGVSDRLALKHGKFLAIEAKKLKSSKPTALQLEFLKQVREHGGKGMVVHRDNLDELEAVLVAFDAKFGA